MVAFGPPKPNPKLEPIQNSIEGQALVVKRILRTAAEIIEAGLKYHMQTAEQKETGTALKASRSVYKIAHEVVRMLESDAFGERTEFLK